MDKKSIFIGLRSFFVLWSSQAVSELGTAMTNFALIIWVYGQKGSTSSITLLTLCSFLPTIFFRFIGGALADRWDKKRIMLIADLLAACGTAAVFILFTFSALQIWHLYVINILLSLMNAVQNPASYVATSLLVPKEQYTRVGGLQSVSGSVITILAPALGSTLLTFGGLPLVLMFDLVSFAIAFVALLFFVKIPEAERKAEAEKEPFLRNCLSGVRFLRDHAPLLHMVLFFTIVNFFAKLGNDGMIAPFVLGRTGNDQAALGMVQTSVALGQLAGSLFMTFAKPAKKKTRLIFIACAVIFLGNIAQGLTRTVSAWCIAAFFTYMTAAIMSANLSTVMRLHVPIEMQGRVFSAKDTLQNCTIPAGIFLGGVLADYVFEPFMMGASPVQGALAPVFGAGKGAGIALMICCVGVVGCILSLVSLKNPVCKSLDEEK